MGGGGLMEASDFPSYVSSKCALKEVHGGMGLFASEPIAKDEAVVVWSGKIVHHSALDSVPQDERDYVYQVDDELYQVAFKPGCREPADYTNHSCEPNCGLRGQICLVAMRPIAVGEHITFDYAMCDISSGTLEFGCGCGSAHCRKWVGQDDWQRPDLWARYEGYFAPHVQRAINRYRKAASDAAAPATTETAPAATLPTEAAAAAAPAPGTTA
eukprot:m.225554 g.225554  ORF g.225554 m.225554 type:complete len:214 (+) comp16728_c0_seq1:57-698(+)